MGIAALFIILPLVNASGFSFVWGNFLNIHVGPLTFSDPLAVLQMTIKNRLLPTGLMISAGMVLAVAFFLGTVFCSWICPFGALSEMVHGLACRVLPRKSGKLIETNKGFSVKLTLFGSGFLVFLLFADSPILNRLSLPHQYSNIFQYLFIQHYMFASIWFIAAILLVEFLFRTRLWCRLFCPQSVLISIAKLFNPFRLKIVFQKKRCLTSKTPGPCLKACSLGLDPRLLNSGLEAQCTNCGDCVDACKKSGNALGFGFKPNL